jgi:hypothetical protein
LGEELTVNGFDFGTGGMMREECCVTVASRATLIYRYEAHWFINMGGKIIEKRPEKTFGKIAIEPKSSSGMFGEYKRL